MDNNILTLDYLHVIIDYNPETGIFTWIMKKPLSRGRLSKKIGRIVGWSANGYLAVTINNKDYYLHRLAWFYMTGEWPEHDIDHKDLNKKNNKWNNLRKATHIENCRNRFINKNNTSGYKGVSWDKKNKKWAANIHINYKKKFIGYYNTAELAHEAYCKAALKYFKDFMRAA